MRDATRTNQQINQGLRKDNTLGFKGVQYHKGTEKWRAGIRVNKILIHLGVFIKINDAAIAYNEAALKYFGEFAFLNEIPD